MSCTELYEELVLSGRIDGRRGHGQQRINFASNITTTKVGVCVAVENHDDLLLWLTEARIKPERRKERERLKGRPWESDTERTTLIERRRERGPLNERERAHTNEILKGITKCIEKAYRVNRFIRIFLS